MATFNYTSNAGQLQKELNHILETVLDNVSKMLLDDFQRHLRDTIYAASEGEYHRYFEQGGFYSGWYIDYMEKYVRALGFDGRRLIAPSADNENSQMSHGGNDGKDYRNDMVWILNNLTSNDYYSYNGGANYLAEGGTSTGYWTSYLNGIDEKITKWLDKEFKKYGISRR